MKHAVDSMAVLQWPEFIALANRLGINLEVSTRRLQIDLQRGVIALVTHDFSGADTREVGEGEPGYVHPLDRPSEADQATIARASDFLRRLDSIHKPRE